MAEATPFVNLEKVARQLGKETPFNESFTTLEINVIYDIALKIEAIVSKFLNISLDDAVKVEYLPASGSQNYPDPDLEDFTSRGDHITVRSRGSGSRYLQLSHTPVLLDDLEVWEDIGANGGQAPNAFADSTKLVLGVDYYLDADKPGFSRSGVLIREGSHWTPYRRCIKVSYKGGPYAAFVENHPSGIDAIDMAIAEAVAHGFKFWQRVTSGQAPGGGLIQSESTGKYSYSLGGPKSPSGTEYGGFTVAIPDEIMATLTLYFDWGNVL